MPVQWFNNEGLHEEAQFIKVIIRGYDADGDGVLGQEEFGTFMTDEDEEDAIDRNIVGLKKWVQKRRNNKAHSFQ